MTQMTETTQIQPSCTAVLKKIPDGRFQATLIDSYRHDPHRMIPETPRLFKATLRRNPQGWYQTVLLAGPIETLKSGDIANLDIVAGTHLVGERIRVRMVLSRKHFPDVPILPIPRHSLEA